MPRSDRASRSCFGITAAAAPALLSAMILFAPAKPADALQQHWSEASYQYNVVDQDLREVFREYGRHLGIIVQISDDVHGRAKNIQATSTAGDFLNRMANDYDLVWYFDGSILHVATAKEVMMQPLQVGNVGFERLEAAIRDICQTDPRLALRPGPDPALVYVTGPASYVSLVQQTAAAIDKAHPTTVYIHRAGQVEQVNF